MMLGPNATRVLRELGLLEDVLAQSGPNTHFLVGRSCGKILMNIALGQFDVPAICMRRSDLLSVLLAALPPECVRLGHELHDLEQSEDKVWLYFEGGLVKEHDAVIGADGIRSRIRSKLFGASDPIYRGYTVWRGLAQYGGNAVPAGCNSETWGLESDSESSTPVTAGSHGMRHRMYLHTIPTRPAEGNANSSRCSVDGTSRLQIFWRRPRKAKS